MLGDLKEKSLYNFKHEENSVIFLLTHIYPQFIQKNTNMHVLL